MASISRLPKPVQESYEWQHDAACVGVDESVFFSPDAERGPSRRAREAAAKALCAICPVARQCLEHALTVREPSGVWGGLCIHERENLRRRSA